MLWIVLGIMAISIITIVVFSTLTLKGYFDYDNGRVSIEIALMRITLLKIIIFECKGNLYYQIGKRDFQRVNFSTRKRIYSATPTPKRKQRLQDLLPIPLSKLHVNLSYRADDMWSGMIRPLIEGFGGVIDYFSRSVIRCDDTYIVINDAYVRRGFMLSFGVSIKVLTIIGLLTKMLIFRSKTRV
ncbi:MAG: hypothetical protein ACI4MY_06405 [Christensenellales bacterium]